MIPRDKIPLSVSVTSLSQVGSFQEEPCHFLLLFCCLSDHSKCLDSTGRL